MLQVLTVLFTLLAPLPVVAQAQHDQIRSEVLSGKMQPLGDILRNILLKHPGRVVDIDLEQGSDGRRWYEIKIANGQLTEVYVDAVTGEEIPRPRSALTLLPMSQVVGALLAAHPGVVVQAELEDEDTPEPHYEIEILTRDGRGQVFRVDARDARVLTSFLSDRVQAQKILPLAGLIGTLESRFKATASEAELKWRPGLSPYYEVELLLQGGRSVEVRVDAYTGAVLTEDRTR